MGLDRGPRPRRPSSRCARRSTFLTTDKELSPDEAYMLASVAVDFCITQLVDGTLGVHGMIPKEIFKKK